MVTGSFLKVPLNLMKGAYYKWGMCIQVAGRLTMQSSVLRLRSWCQNVGVGWLEKNYLCQGTIWQQGRDWRHRARKQTTCVCFTHNTIQQWRNIKTFL